MRDYNLDKEEEQLLKEIEAGEWKPVKNQKKAKEDLLKAVKNTLGKTRNINIRVAEKVLLKIKAKANHEGIPYQTLVPSVLHKFVNA